jgi:hypothetical protein
MDIYSFRVLVGDDAGKAQAALIKVIPNLLPLVGSGAGLSGTVNVGNDAVVEWRHGEEPAAQALQPSSLTVGGAASAGAKAVKPLTGRALSEVLPRNLPRPSLEMLEAADAAASHLMSQKAEIETEKSESGEALLNLAETYQKLRAYVDALGLYTDVK